MKRRKIEVPVYLFEIDEKSPFKHEYVLTSESEINPYCIERIYGKVKVKGSKKVFEKVEIRTNFGEKFVCLIERKYLNFDVVSSFIKYYYNGERSAQHHPYTEDLFDNDLLNDLNIEVLTYKHYYARDDFLVDHFRAVRKDEITPDLLSLLEKRTNSAIECQKAMKELNKEQSAHRTVWKNYKLNKRGESL